MSFLILLVFVAFATSYLFGGEAQIDGPSQDESAQATTFRAQTNLVLVPFHVTRGDGSYVQNLKSSDVVLLENGVPRKPTVFAGGATGGEKPTVDMSLVFDISAGGASIEWNLDAAYTFLSENDLNRLNMAVVGWIADLDNVSLSVYWFRKTKAADGKPATELRRLSTPSRNPDTITQALRRLALPEPGGEKIPTQLPPNRKLRTPREAAERSMFYQTRTWVYESVIAAVKDMAGTSQASARIAVIFSIGLSPTTTTVEDVAKTAQEHAVTLYPVMLDRQRWVSLLTSYRLRVDAANANSKRQSRGAEPIGASVVAAMQQVLDDMDRFGTFGQLTGGQAFDYNTVDLSIMQKILKSMRDEVEGDYVIGFAPQPSSNGSREHKLQVRLVNGKLGKLRGGTREVAY